MDEQELIQNPEALLALMQQAVQHLIEQHPDTAAQEAQLRAVAKAIGELEKLNVPVPDSLRQTKMTLLAEIGQQTQFDQQLRMIGEGLVEVLEIIESAAGKPRSEGKSQKDSTPRQRRPRGSGPPTTSHSILRTCMIQVLVEFGGSAHCSKILDRMQELLEGQLLAGDLEMRGRAGEPVWRNNSRWERQAMISEGVLRNDSKYGYWELNPDYVSGNDKPEAYQSI
jgi:hypothetical protein